MLVHSSPTVYSGIYASFTFTDIMWVHLTISSPTDLISSLLPGFHLTLPLLWSILHTIILNQRMLFTCLVISMVFQALKVNSRSIITIVKNPWHLGPAYLPSLASYQALFSLSELQIYLPFCFLNIPRSFSLESTGRFPWSHPISLKSKTWGKWKATAFPYMMRIKPPSTNQTLFPGLYELEIVFKCHFHT